MDYSQKLELIEARAQARRIMDFLRGEFNLRNPDFDRLQVLANNLISQIELVKIIDSGMARIIDAGIAKQQADSTESRAVQ